MRSPEQERARRRELWALHAGEKRKKKYRNNLSESREKGRRRYAADPEKYKERARLHYAARSPDRAAKIRERDRIYKRRYRKLTTAAAKAYVERDRALARRRNQENPEAHKAACARWVAANPDRVRQFAIEHGNRRRAAKRGNLTSPVDYAAVQYGTCGCCGICGEQVGPRFHYDHIIPIVRGGSHTTENLQLAHPTCNHKKHAKMPPMKEAA